MPRKSTTVDVVKDYLRQSMIEILAISAMNSGADDVLSESEVLRCIREVIEEEAAK